MKFGLSLHSPIVWNQVSRRDFHCILSDDNLRRLLKSRAAKIKLLIFLTKKKKSLYNQVLHFHSTKDSANIDSTALLHRQKAGCPKQQFVQPLPQVCVKLYTQDSQFPTNPMSQVTYDNGNLIIKTNDRTDTGNRKHRSFCARKVNLLGRTLKP